MAVVGAYEDVAAGTANGRAGGRVNGLANGRTNGHLNSGPAMLTLPMRSLTRIVDVHTEKHLEFVDY
jgi:hypothetical protein